MINLETVSAQGDGNAKQDISAIRQLDLAELGSLGTIELSVVITFFDAERSLCYFHDGSGGISLVSEFPLPELETGELVRVTGRCISIRNRMVLRCSEIESLGVASLPESPSDRSGKLAEAADGDWLTLEGFVQRQDPLLRRLDFSVMIDDGERLTVSALSSAVRSDSLEILRSRISVSGVLHEVASATSGEVSRQLLVPSMDFLEITQSRQTILAQAEERSIGEIKSSHFDQRQASKIRGRLTYSRGKLLCLQNGDSAICIRTRAPIASAVGSIAEFVGFVVPILQTVEFRGYLSETSESDVDRVVPVDLSDNEIRQWDASGRFVRIRGEFLHLVRGRDPWLMVLRRGMWPIEVQFEEQIIEQLTESLTPGMTLEVTGILRSNPEADPEFSPIVYPRHSEDIRVVSAAPWSMKKTLAVVSGLSAGLGIGLLSLGAIYWRLRKSTEKLKVATQELTIVKSTLERLVEHRTERLSQSVSVLEATIASTSDGILVVDTGGEITQHNQTFLDLWSLTEAELLSIDGATLFQRMEARLSAPDAGLWSREDPMITSERQSVDTLLLRDGRVVKCSSKPRVQGSRIVGRVWSFRDITIEVERRHLLENIFESAFDGIINVDRKLRVLLVNQSAAKMIGCSREDAIGSPLEKFLPALRTHGDLMLQEKGRILSLSGLRASGERFPIEASVASSRQDGEDYYTIVLSDVSDRRIAEQQQRDLAARLSRTRKLEAVGTLASGVAHDFNNLLAIIYSNSELCQLEVDDHPDASGYLKKIIDGCNRGKELVQQIESFAKREDLPQEVIAIGGRLSGIVSLLRPSIPSTIKLRVNVAEDLPLIKANASQIDQIILNLATNSIHAMLKKPGELSIEAMRCQLDETALASHPQCSPGTYLNLKVRDTGDGISPEVQKRMFEPFFSTKPAGSGSGLGLSTVLGLVESHDGFMEVESGEGVGTVFDIYFPAVESTSNDVIADGKGERILLVDDDRSVLQSLTRCFESMGYEVTPYQFPISAVAEFDRRPDYFDLVFTDLAMPKMTGIELVSAIRQKNERVTIILASGYTEGADLSPEIKAELFSVIRKPFDVATLREVMLKCFRR